MSILILIRMINTVISKCIKTDFFGRFLVNTKREKIKRSVSCFNNLNSFTEKKPKKIPKKPQLTFRDINVLDVRFLNIMFIADAPRHSSYEDGDDWNGHLVIEGQWIEHR